MKRSGAALSMGVFAAVFLWVAFLTQGLRIGDPDDWDHLLIARDISAGTLVQNIVTPWSTSTEWTGQAGRMNETLNRRVFLTFVLKSIHTAAGFRDWPYYLFSKALFFAVTCTLFFALLRRLTGSLVVSSGALLFYVLAPAHYPHLFWITDPITMVHAFMLTGITCWLAAARRLETKSEAPPYVIPLAGLLAAGWLAMKTKEPALAMPLALGLATLGSALRWKGAGKQILAMLAILGILVFLLVPIHHLGRASDENFIYNPQTIVRMLLRNFDCGYQDESASAFVSLERVWPVSVARTFGFFLLWTLAAAAVRRLRELRNRKGEAPADSRLLLRVFVCWLIVEIPWMGYFQPDPRYFSGTLIPLTALAAYLAAESLRASSRRFWTAALVFSLLWALAQNAYAIVWLRQKVGERTARFRGFAEALYTDQFGRSPSPEQLGRFYCAQYVPDPAAPRIADSLFYAGFGYEAWNRTPPGERDAAAFSRFAKEGAVYYAGDVPDPFPGSPILREVRRIECRNPESRIESLIHFLHPGPPVWFYLFKYQEPVHEPT